MREKFLSQTNAYSDAQKVANDFCHERARQVAVKSYTYDRDDRYTEYELARAAGAYALQEVVSGVELYPWAEGTFDAQIDYRDRLIRAGALLIAEIQRIDRANTPESRALRKIETCLNLLGEGVGVVYVCVSRAHAKELAAMLYRKWGCSLPFYSLPGGRVGYKYRDENRGPIIEFVSFNAVRDTMFRGTKTVCVVDDEVRGAIPEGQYLQIRAMEREHGREETH